MAKPLKIATKIPLKIVRRVIESKAVQQSIAIGSIEQYQNDLVITYSDGETEIVDVTVEMNDRTIATTGAISGAIYAALQLQFLRRWRGLSRAKVAESLVLKIEANIILIQRLMDGLRGQALGFYTVKTVDEGQEFVKLFKDFAQLIDELKTAVEMMDDNVKLLRLANNMASLDTGKIINVRRSVQLADLAIFGSDMEGIRFRHGFDASAEVVQFVESNADVAKQAFMLDDEIKGFQKIVESNNWFSSNKGAIEVANQFIDPEDVLGLDDYISEAKVMLTNTNLVTSEAASNMVWLADRIKVGSGTTLIENKKMFYSYLRKVVDDIKKGTSIVHELRQTGIAVSAAVGKAEKAAVLAGMGRTAQAVYRFSPRIAGYLGATGRFFGFVSMIDLAIWAGTGLLIDLPLNLFMDEEEQGFFADRAGFSFIGEGFEWLFLKAFNQIYAQAPESLYDAFMTMLMGAIVSDNFQTTTEIITKWFIDNISVDVLVPLGWDIELGTIDGITILDRFIPPKDPLAILEVATYLIAYKLVFTLWVLPAFGYLTNAIKS